MKTIIRFLRSLNGCQNRRRHSRIRHLSEAMAWFNAPNRR